MISAIEIRRLMSCRMLALLHALHLVFRHHHALTSMTRGGVAVPRKPHFNSFTVDEDVFTSLHETEESDNNTSFNGLSLPAPIALTRLYAEKKGSTDADTSFSFLTPLPQQD
ncbi:hypothetical protein FS842_003683 [Serendipita sp. 407]|nr:hypothetical protein FS842_003683 [Serendipita sp. 407]